MTQLPMLVLGATGKTGRRIVDRLAAHGAPTRAGSRSAEPPFDWNDRSTWAPVLDGVGAVYITLGRPPRDFRDYARETAAAGAW